jgi:hypothetical protein
MVKLFDSHFGFKEQPYPDLYLLFIRRKFLSGQLHYSFAEHSEYEVTVDVLLICGFDPRMPPNPRDA